MPDAKEATRFILSSEAASDLASPVKQQGEYIGFGMLHHTLLQAGLEQVNQTANAVQGRIRVLTFSKTVPERRLARQVSCLVAS